MRVGFDARWYNQSGVGTYIAELLKAFAEIPKAFELVVYEDPENPVPVLNGSRISRVPMRSSKYSLAGQFELRAHCKSAQIDLFHSPYQYGVPLLLSCPLVVTVHDLIPFLFRTRSWPKQLLAVPLVKMGYRAAAFRAHHIIADSANTARDVEWILKVPPCRITSIHLAASEIPFHSRSDPSEKGDLFAKYGVHSPYVVVASAGCNWRTKNLEGSLSALALGRRSSGIDFQTVVYGPGDGIETLSKRNLTFELNIQRVGYLPVCDLAALFRNAQLFIMPSLYEGFGLPILEAMSCGCPIVTSNAGSLAEVAGYGAQTFAPSSVDEMGKAVARLLACPQVQDKWRRLATTRAADFSWKRTARDTAAVYQKVYGDA
jgi:glycosyltransferase involved in cell wall biosynthesis